MLPMTVAQSSIGGVMVNYVFPVSDDFIFAYKPRLLDVATQLKLSANAALGLALNCAQ